MRPELRYGLIAGTGVCLWVLAEHALGFHTTRPEMGAYSGSIAALIPLGPLLYLLQAKQAATAGRLKLRAGISAGFVCSLLATFIVCSFLLAYNQYLNPGWIDVALDNKVAQLRALGVAETAIREDITAFRRMNSPAGVIVATLLRTTLLGTLLSAGLTLVVRRPAQSARMTVS